MKLESHENGLFLYMQLGKASLIKQVSKLLRRQKYAWEKA